MEFSNDIPAPMPATKNRTLKVNYKWKKNQALVSEQSETDSHPLYVVEHQTFRAPHMIFRSTSNDTIIGNSTFHLFSIDPDCELHGRPVKLKARRRFVTEYSYSSLAFSPDGHTPVTMSWTSDCGVKTWEFICMNDQQLPVAKFVTNNFSSSRMGTIEFLDNSIATDLAREEIVVMGMTLFSCMVLRTQSLFQFFGALAHRKGDEKVESAPSISSISSTSLRDLKGGVKSEIS